MWVGWGRGKKGSVCMFGEMGGGVSMVDRVGLELDVQSKYANNPDVLKCTCDISIGS